MCVCVAVSMYVYMYASMKDATAGRNTLRHAYAVGHAYVRGGSVQNHITLLFKKYITPFGA